MKRANGFYIIVNSINELCSHLQNNNIEIVGMRTVKGEDRVIIDYVYKHEEES